MKPLRTLALALSTLIVPLASFAQTTNGSTPSADHAPIAVTEQQSTLQPSTDKARQQQASPASALTYGAPMNGSSDMGRRLSTRQTSTLFEHH